MYSCSQGGIWCVSENDDQHCFSLWFVSRTFLIPGNVHNEPIHKTIKYPFPLYHVDFNNHDNHAGLDQWSAKQCFKLLGFFMIWWFPLPEQVVPTGNEEHVIKRHCFLIHNWWLPMAAPVFHTVQAFPIWVDHRWIFRDHWWLPTLLPLISRQFNLFPLGKLFLDALNGGYLWKTKTQPNSL